MFVRIDAFIERCHDVLDITTIIVQFSKLSKIEIGSTKGEALTESVQQIYHDFELIVSLIKGVDYDIMDVSIKDFEDDYFQFRQSVKKIECRLGAVICLGLSDCTTVYGRFQLLNSFDNKVLSCPIIRDK